MRVPYIPPSKSSRLPWLQSGGELPGVSYGAGYFGNLRGFKKVALQALKDVAKASLPMAKAALMAGLKSKGSVKQRLRVAGQTALTKKNLVGLAKAGRKSVMARPF